MKCVVEAWIAIDDMDLLAPADNPATPEPLDYPQQAFAASSAALAGAAEKPAAAEAPPASDETFRRPRGRAPNGKMWDSATGMWVSIKDAGALAAPVAPATAAPAFAQAPAAPAAEPAPAPALPAPSRAPPPAPALPPPAPALPPSDQRPALLVPPPAEYVARPPPKWVQEALAMAGPAALGSRVMAPTKVLHGPLHAA